MKVIEQPPPMQAQCGHCKALLELEFSDIQVENTAMAYAGETYDPVLYFLCPVCKSRNYRLEFVPPGIRAELIESARPKR